MFSVREKREIAEKIQRILRETNHPELPKGEIEFHIHVKGAEEWSWADIKNNGAVDTPQINPHNEMQDPQSQIGTHEKTYSEQFNEALACETKQEAEKWMLAEIERYSTLPDFSGGEAEARKIILRNIGYTAGYYGQAEQEKIYNLFGAEHPIFGKPADAAKITPEQAFQAGINLAKSYEIS